MEDLRCLLADTIEDVLPSIVSLRRRIHSNPELSREERETSISVAEVLRSEGIGVAEGVYGYGMTADLLGKDGPAIGFRGDMDALPLKEETGVSFASCRDGVMHACGHDCHTAILTGTAMVLKRLERYLPRSVRFIFQPSEEDNPVGGACGMIEAGAIKGLTSLYGLHLWPDLPLGSVGVKSGPLMAASDHVTIDIKGLASHAAKPQAGIDAAIIGSYVATSLQTLLSRRVSPFDPAVLTFGRIEAGSRYNILADRAQLDGTCRTFSEEVRVMMEEELGRMAESIAGGFGASCEVTYRRGYPALNNDFKLAEAAMKLSLDDGTMVSVEEPSMIAEDFSYYAREIPSLFMWLGCSSEGHSGFALHNPKFLPDERVLKVGMELFSSIALGI